MFHVYNQYPEPYGASLDRIFVEVLDGSGVSGWLRPSMSSHWGLSWWVCHHSPQKFFWEFDSSNLSATDVILEAFFFLDAPMDTATNHLENRCVGTATLSSKHNYLSGYSICIASRYLVALTLCLHSMLDYRQDPLDQSQMNCQWFSDSLHMAPQWSASAGHVQAPEKAKFR